MVTTTVRRVILVCITVLAFFVISSVAKAQAHVNVVWKETSVDCWKFGVTISREGELFHSNLWSLNQHVNWCTDSPPVTQVFRGPFVHRGHNENVTWNFIAYDTRWVKKFYNPVRWQFQVIGHFLGNGGYILSDNDYPSITMTIWKANPSHVSYTAKCGC